MIISLIICVILILFSALFSSAETAFTSANRIRLKNLSEHRGNKSAAHALRLLANYDRLISTLLVGNNIINLSISSIATVATVNMLTESVGEEFASRYGAVISTAVITAAVITFGEIIPKTIARTKPEFFCMAFCGIIRVLSVILLPFTLIFSIIQKLIGKIFRTDEKHSGVTEDELVSIVEEVEADGILEADESVLVTSALRFDETAVKEILTPRVKIVAVPDNAPFDKILEIFSEEGYSRIPVYDKDIDHITGVLNIKDFVKQISQIAGNLTHFSRGEPTDVHTFKQDPQLIMSGISSLKSAPLFITENRKISDVFREMQMTKTHLAVIVDQYGGTLGIVTLEDIMEELVGEIWDESDREGTDGVFPEAGMMLKKGINECILDVAGAVSKNECNRFLARNGIYTFSFKGESSTVGGVVLELFGKIPSRDEIFRDGNFSVRILSMDGNRVDTVRVKISNLN